MRFTDLVRSPWLALGLTSLIGGLFGCDNTSVEVEGTRTDEPVLEGTTAEGERVIFAGAQGPRERPEAPAPRPRYNEDDLIREPNAPDPEAGEFTLEEAVVGLEIDGSLIVEISTQFGDILCELDPQRAPVATANFIGLARGLRPWWDARAGQWVREPYYRGLTFHRVIPGYLIQGGDYLGDGTGTVGYTLEDERDDTLSHDRAGQLCMANADGPNSAGAQFFITDGPAPQLDEGGYTIFGQCRPADVISQIARVPQNADEGNRPLTDVNIRRVLVRRVQGGLAAAEPTRPELPPGEPEVPRGASRDPSARGHRRFDPTQFGDPSPQRGGPPVQGGHAGHNH